MEEDIKILEELRKELGLYANGEKIKQGQALENLIKGYRELEKKSKQKPYWEQIMIKEKMTIEEAETIIDDMYQDRNKILRKTGGTETEVIFDVAKLDDVKFTNLEFASVRALREIQSLRRKLNKSIPKSKIKEKIEELENSPYWADCGDSYEKDIELLKSLLES